MRETIDFGIDLGTTNSALAVCEAGKVSIIKNNDGWDYTPSAVWLPKAGRMYVGRRARYGAADDPTNVAMEFKQDMGVADATREFPNAGVQLGPVELSAEVLKSLRKDAEHQFGEMPASAVITVPAAFGLNQNEATAQAAALAGLGDQCPLLQEPTAAAFAYGFADESDRAYWMVFDFGGGTFDAAVVSKRDGEMLVLDHVGDRYLGGKLIDWALVEELLAPAAARELGLADFDRNNPAWAAAFGKLKLAAEDVKIQLSRTESVDVDVDLPDGRGGVENLELAITRDELDRIAEPFYIKAINLCFDALRVGNLRPANIDRLLLVGGTTLMPSLRERLADPKHGLGITVDHSQDPTTVVARGAAIFASTVRAPREFVPPRPGEFTAELEYPPTTSSLIPPVGGRLHSGTEVDWTSYSVTLDNSASQPPFRGPSIALSADGTFFTEVSLVPNDIGRFTVELTDGSGARQRLSPDTFTITHAPVDIGPAVLTSSIGIGRADRVFTPMLRKGTQLPAKVRELFVTTIPLRRADTESVIRIPVVEGERGRADRNRQVAMMEIRPRDVRIDLPVGSEVEVTFEIDESRRVTVVADVPVVREQFEAEIDLSHVRPPDVAELRRRHAEVEQRRRQLLESAENVGSSQAIDLLDRLDKEKTIDNAGRDLGAGDPGVGAAAQRDQELRDVQSVLDDVENAVRLPQLTSELENELADCRAMVAESGNDDDRRELEDLERRAAAAIRDQDVDAIEAQTDRARNLYNDVLRNTPHWEMAVFNSFRGRLRDKLRPADRADALIREGEQAVEMGDLRALEGVNDRLRRLLPLAERKVEGGVLPAQPR